MSEFELSADKVILRMVEEIILPFHESHIDGFRRWGSSLDLPRREVFVSEVQPTMMYSITELYQQRSDNVRVYCNKSSLIPTYICPENTVRYVAEHLPEMITQMCSPNWASLWLREKIMWMRGLLKASTPFRDGLKNSQFWKSVTEEGDEFASFITTEGEGEAQGKGLISFMQLSAKAKMDPEHNKFFKEQMEQCAFCWKGEADFILNVCFGFVQAVCSLTDEYGLTISKHLTVPATMSILHLENQREGGNSCSKCLKTTENPKSLLACGKCLMVQYCSKECQVGDWKTHKKSCFKNGAGSAKAKEVLNKADKDKADKPNDKKKEEEAELPPLSFKPKLGAFFLDLSTGTEPPVVVPVIGDDAADLVKQVEAFFKSCEANGRRLSAEGAAVGVSIVQAHKAAEMKALRPSTNFAVLDDPELQKMEVMFYNYGNGPHFGARRMYEVDMSDIPPSEREGDAGDVFTYPKKAVYRYATTQTSGKA